MVVKMHGTLLVKITLSYILSVAPKGSLYRSPQWSWSSVAGAAPPNSCRSSPSPHVLWLSPRWALGASRTPPSRCQSSLPAARQWSAGPPGYTAAPPLHSAQTPQSTSANTRQERAKLQ